MSEDAIGAILFFLAILLVAIAINMAIVDEEKERRKEQIDMETPE